MPTKKKVLPGTEAWSDPAPLAPPATGNPVYDGLLQEMRDGRDWFTLSPDLRKLLAQPSESEVTMLVGQLTPEMLQPGCFEWNPIFFASLEARKARAYQKRYKACSTACIQRQRVLGLLLAALGRHPAAEERVLSVALDHPDPVVRNAASSALLGKVPWANGPMQQRQNSASPRSIERLTTLLEIEGPGPGPEDVRCAGVEAVFRVESPTDAYDRLAPYVTASLVPGSDGIEGRALAVMKVLGERLGPRDDSRWRGLLARVLREGTGMLQSGALSGYARVALDAPMEESLLAFTHAQQRLCYMNPVLVPMLERCRDRRAALLLARGIPFVQGVGDKVLAALQRLDVAASAPALRAAPDAPAAWRLVADWLERNGPASEEELQALDEMPELRVWGLHGAGPSPR